VRLRGVDEGARRREQPIAFRTVGRYGESCGADTGMRSQVIFLQVGDRTVVVA